MKKHHEDYEDNLILDENGKPIPSYVCICAAHSASECGCGAWDVSFETWKTLDDNSEVVE